MGFLDELANKIIGNAGMESVPDLNLTDAERELVAIGKLAPNQKAIAAYRAKMAPKQPAKKMPDANVTKGGLGLSDEDQLMKLQNDLIKRRQAVQKSGVLGFFQ